MNTIGRMRLGWSFFRKSLSIFFSRKEFLLFPVFKTLAFTLLTCLLAFLIYFFIEWNTFQEFLNLFDKDKPCHPEFVDYIILLASGFMMYFVATFVDGFFSVALCDYTRNVMNRAGMPISVSFNHARRKLGKITLWSLFTATVMLILQVINAVLERFKLRFLARFFTFLGEMAWAIATFFIFPVIAFENRGMIDNVKRSHKILRDSFGESLTGIFIFNILPLILFFPYIICCSVGTVGFYFMIEYSTGIRNSPANVMYFVVIPLFMLLYFYAAMINTLKTIFTTAVYESLVHGGAEVFPLNEIKQLSSYKKKK